MPLREDLTMHKDIIIKIYKNEVILQDKIYNKRYKLETSNKKKYINLKIFKYQFII